MAKKLKIAVLVDVASIPEGDPEFRDPPADEQSTEFHVIEALRIIGYDVSVLAAVEDVSELVAYLKEANADLVFNLTEQLGGDRRGDKNIASLLDMLGIKYTGSGPQGLMLSRDKRLCKDILSLHKIRVPGFISIPVKKKQQIPKHIQYPLVVKPAFEDSSEGIANASLVNAENALRERAAFIHDRWNQAAIAEEFIEGRELYVGVLGNKKLMVLPVRECHFQGPQGEGPIMATYRVKWDYEYRQKWNIKFGFAELDDDVLKNIQRICKKVYRILQIRDYGRIDLRLRPDGKIVVLEANPNPDIAYGEEVAEAAEKAGISYEELMGKIIQLALKRYA